MFFVRFWGVRGSIPVPGPSTMHFGGNTPCVEVRAGSEILIFDGGTGLRALGGQLAPGGTPVFKRYRVYKEKDFSTLIL